MDKTLGKKSAALAALDYIKEDLILGVGTGSTMDIFIEQLATRKSYILGAVASSKRTADKLKSLGIPLIEANSANEISLYIDGADEINSAKQMIKGGGGALTGEKIVATIAKKFICIVDESKVVPHLGNFPIAIEVLPMARSYVARQLVKMGGDPLYREGFVTDYGNVILDVYNLKLLNPIELETQLNSIVGVVECGVFAKRTADIVLVGAENSVRKL